MGKRQTWGRQSRKADGDVKVGTDTEVGRTHRETTKKWGNGKKIWRQKIKELNEGRQDRRTGE